MPINTEMLHAQSPDDVAALKARIAELEEENKRLKEEAVSWMEETTRARNEKMAMFEKLANVNFENECLKSELYAVKTDIAMSQRWRKVSEEFPTADEGHVWVLWEVGLPDVGYIGAVDVVIEAIRASGEGHSVERWMPKAPEEK